MEEEVRALCRLVFEDEKEFEDAFFSTVYTPEDTVVKRVNGKIVAMAFCTPCTIRMKDNAEPTATASYIHYFCTHPDYRNKGYADEIMNSALRLCEERDNCFALLVPASLSLFAYYSRFGFITCFDRDEQRAATAARERGCIASFPRLEALRRILPTNTGSIHSERYGMARIINKSKLEELMPALFPQITDRHFNASIQQLTQACIGYNVQQLPAPLNNFPSARPVLYQMYSE